MGLKYEVSAEHALSCSALKSDQDGIEIFLPPYFSAPPIPLKSDQDGIEIKYRFSRFLLLLLLKSDQDGIEIVFLEFLLLACLR